MRYQIKIYNTKIFHFVKQYNPKQKIITDELIKKLTLFMLFTEQKKQLLIAPD